MRKRRKQSPNDARLRVDVRDLLDRLGIEVHEDKGTEVVVRCRSGLHEDKTPSLGIHTEGERNGLLYCFSCHWGASVFDLVMRVRDCDFSDALGVVRRSASDRIEEGDDEDEDEGLYAPHEPPEILPPGDTRPIMTGSRCMRYLERRRRVTWEEVLRYGLRDWPRRRRVWVPVTRRNVLISWVARSYNGGEPKVRTPKGGGLGRSWALFGLDQADRDDGRICLCEAWVDVIRLVQARFVNPVGAGGSALSKNQVEDLSWVRRALLFREGDVGGEAFERTTRQWLGGRCEIDVVNHPPGKDPAKHTVKGLLKLCTDEQLETFT